MPNLDTKSSKCSICGKQAFVRHRTKDLALCMDHYISETAVPLYDAILKKLGGCDKCGHRDECENLAENN